MGALRALLHPLSSLSQSPRVPVPPHPGQRPGGRGDLESQRLCRSGAERPPLRAPPQLLPGQRARTPLIIEQKYCSIPGQPARLPFFLPARGADINVGARCCSAVAQAASQQVLTRLLQGWGGFLISKFSALPYQFACSMLIPSHCPFFPPRLFAPERFLAAASFHPRGISPRRWGAGGAEDHLSTQSSAVPRGGGDGSGHPCREEFCEIFRAKEKTTGKLYTCKKFLKRDGRKVRKAAKNEIIILKM